MINLHGRRFRVVSASGGSVVSSDTVLTLEQNGILVSGHYRGGDIVDGRLIGCQRGPLLHFRYVQGNDAGVIDSGVSDADIEQDAEGRVILTEHYRWITRDGTGTNIFAEIIGCENT